MKIIVSLLLFVAGGGCILYSYIGSLVALAGDVGRSANEGDLLSAFEKIMDFLLRGELPRLTSFLYVGVLLIAIAIVNLIVRSQP
ncbi:MAG TPA: hypothetical protein VNH64_11005, partial [Parvularculaceae bacterium]|nr:hypothetical protein [Parvularculaceae bacterium]